MVLESNLELAEDRETDAKTAALDGGSGALAVEDESEEEDVDFNPFFKESLSEASSSLSSEAEGLDTDVVNSHCGNGNEKGNRNGNENDEKCADLVDEGNEDSVLGSEQGGDKENAVEVEVKGVNSRGRDRDNDEDNADIIDFDDEDAICKRTRARYSLASFTLDELETFLQESDDDEDVQNVDEEEEYKKFLAAVLSEGNRDDQGSLEGTDDDDDEDNDADFEIEIEEALESDIDDCVETCIKEDKHERGSRRPETRQKGRQKVNERNKNKDTQRGKVPLRPLVPVSLAATAPCLGPRCFTLETTMPFPSWGQGHLSMGFQAHQIGQLYCLIYEHVQLLVQVYSLCVLDPSRQQIASQIKGLLSELLHKRDLVLAWRNEPYPSSCFLPSFTCPSVSVENKKVAPAEDSDASPSGQGSQWLPTVSGSVVSVLDVAPLKLAGKYMDSVANAVREHQRRCLETTNLYLEKQPLFPHPKCPSPEGECNITRGNATSLNSNEVSPNCRAPKKTLAATLVESTKKQSVALVSSEIAKLAQPFYLLFNPALFPYKPPSSAVANRVLFTDAEDVLVAIGMMEYNNDWKAIQQRFLPCKSEHQIFVRAKNRCSSKAPENPIKAVRKMKTSPLTEEEKVRIQEGLKTFKLDWTSVWRFVVPYRDPNLLPRQWRIAIGTQKSYKADSAKRERHRIYESRRRRLKMVARDYSLTGSEQNVTGKDCMDNDNEAYVHEAFLADWRPSPSELSPSKMAFTNQQAYIRGELPVTSSCDVQVGADNHNNQSSQSDQGLTHELPTAVIDSRLICNKALHPHTTHNHPPSTLSSIKYGALHYAQNVGNCNASNLVKLAPELPPVKLPSAVRVISQSSLKRTGEVGATGPGLEKTFRDPTCVDRSAILLKPTQDKNKMSNSNCASFPSLKDGPMSNSCLTERRGTETDPQMHPLLFRTIEEGHSLYYPVNTSIRIPTFSFFPAVQHKMNATLIQNSCTGDPSFSSKEFASESSLDFHPLLKRAKGFSGGPLDSGLTSSFLNTNLELSRDQFADDIVYNAGAIAAQMAAANRTTSHSAEANDLDLDIHLNSSCRKRKVSNHEVAEKNLTFSSVDGTVVEAVNERSDMHCEFSLLSEPQPADQNTGSHSETSAADSCAALSHKPDGYNGLCINANAGDHSLSEIVMEQEELSDSDEEMEEVEFEREEIADSDGEEESAEKVENIHKKETSVIGLGGDNPAQLLKSLASEASGGTRAQKKGRKPRLGSVGPGRAQDKSSWLSLNSHGSHCKPLNNSRAISSESPPVSSHLNGQSKKGISGAENVSSSEQKTGSLQDPFFNALRKPKKNLSSSSLRIDVHSGILSCTDKDGKD